MTGQDLAPDMRVGVILPARGPLATGDAIAEAAAYAEAAGFASVWSTDHIIFPRDVGFIPPHTHSFDGKPRWDPKSSWLEAMIALTWAGARTSTIRLGTAIIVLPVRSVLHTAKQVASLDFLTGGRVVLGVGAGWQPTEFEYLGANFEDRGRRLSEGIELLRACWADDPIHYGSDYHQVQDAVMKPKPAQGPALPILVGGDSPAALKRAARLGDGWIASQLTPEEAGQGRARLYALAEAAGRTTPPEIYVRAPNGTTIDGPLLDEYRRAGVSELLVDLHHTAQDTAEYFRRLREVGVVASEGRVPS